MVIVPLQKRFLIALRLRNSTYDVCVTHPPGDIPYMNKSKYTFPCSLYTYIVISTYIKIK